jgi:uncharacterized RDD family membrane protein YckC
MRRGTAEGAADFRLARAGLVSRGIAGVVDLTLIAVSLIAGYFIFCAVLFMVRPRAFTFPDPGRLWSIGVASLVAIAYLTLGWYLSGRTPGKQLAGLRVVTERHHRPLSGPLALGRATLYVIFPAGLFWSAFSRKSASVQDLILRTVVVYDWRKWAIEPDAPHVADAPSEDLRPGLAG